MGDREPGYPNEELTRFGRGCVWAVPISVALWALIIYLLFRLFLQ